MKALTESDKSNLSKLPETEWFEEIDVWPRVKRTYYSLNRLVDAGYVEGRWIDNVKKYRKIKSLSPP